MIHEVKRSVSSGYTMLAVLTAAQLGSAYLIFLAAKGGSVPGVIGAVLAF